MAARFEQLPADLFRFVSGSLGFCPAAVPIGNPVSDGDVAPDGCFLVFCSDFFSSFYDFFHNDKSTFRYFSLCSDHVFFILNVFEKPAVLFFGFEEKNVKKIEMSKRVSTFSRPISPSSFLSFSIPLPDVEVFRVSVSPSGFQKFSLDQTCFNVKDFKSEKGFFCCDKEGNFSNISSFVRFFPLKEIENIRFPKRMFSISFQDQKDLDEVFAFLPKNVCCFVVSKNVRVKWETDLDEEVICFIEEKLKRKIKTDVFVKTKNNVKTKIVSLRGVGCTLPPSLILKIIENINGQILKSNSFKTLVRVGVSFETPALINGKFLIEELKEIKELKNFDYTKTAKKNPPEPQQPPRNPEATQKTQQPQDQQPPKDVEEEAQLRSEQPPKNQEENQQVPPQLQDQPQDQPNVNQKKKNQQEALPPEAQLHSKNRSRFSTTAC